ncbi:hypothetical protein A2U01_0045428 [Trifolium medium]|uniref:Uncharacterized protein n=1 Tax=Trifolium medium TaxID=97028 RepID=A0A392QLS9_9FABA|nr:hypothetical protein [Trifolium medium]
MEERRSKHASGLPLAAGQPSPSPARPSPAGQPMNPFVESMAQPT